MAHWPTKENRQNSSIFRYFRPTQKITQEGPKWGREVLFPAHPDLVDILGRTDLDFENLYFFDSLDPKFLDFQVPRFPKSGPGQARLEPSGPKNLDFLL